MSALRISRVSKGKCDIRKNEAFTIKATEINDQKCKSRLDIL